MRTHFLIIFCLIITSNLFSQSKKDSSSTIVQRILIKYCSDCSYDIIYENRKFKLYFNKSKLLKFADNYLNKGIIGFKEFSYYKKDNIDINKVIAYIKKTEGIIYFSDPFWEMDINPMKYKYNETNDLDFKNTPQATIERNKYLEYSQYFEQLISRYLMEGECKIFNKEHNLFVFTNSINLVRVQESSDYKYGGYRSDDYFYQLQNGTIITYKTGRLTIIDKFPEFLKDIN